jgi:D-glycerate 3-kinase
MAQPWLDDFLAMEDLPGSFRTTVERVCAPIAELAEDARRALGRTVVVGVCGPQGSGKSTIAAATREILTRRGRTAAVLGLDDLYLPKADRARLAAEVHPLLATRGPPGTHDPALGLEVLDCLAQPGELIMPSFDKAADTRRPPEDGEHVRCPVDVILFEGWCVGARAQPPAALVEPVNSLEREEDPDGRWRTFVNNALGGPYQALFARLDRLVLLAPADFAVVAGWRAEQEAKLRARTGRGMGDDEIVRFVAHYERLTRWILEEMPTRADRVFPLAADRSPAAGASTGRIN